MKSEPNNQSEEVDPIILAEVERQLEYLVAEGLVVITGTNAAGKPLYRLKTDEEIEAELRSLDYGEFSQLRDELGIEIEFGDYIGYYETEKRVRYYSVANDGRVVSDNKHTYAGYKPFYRTIVAVPVNQNEFRGL